MKFNNINSTINLTINNRGKKGGGKKSLKIMDVILSPNLQTQSLDSLAFTC